ncbi:putative bifunctional diguanylate cyclase/phosphodiesterase, partial [Ideonella sp.]|uniref:putative bifunctional diguanylate cyclase/phosphodiesterase n=1 Tax=Ideonella sp. TaxID=1929293 RepID=UPI003BB52E74
QALLAGAPVKPALAVTVGGRCLNVSFAVVDIAAIGARLLLSLDDSSRSEDQCQDVCTPAAHYRNQAALLDKATDAIIVRDMDDRIAFWNMGAERLYGWSAGEAQGAPRVGAMYDDPAQLQEIKRQVLAHGCWRGELVQLRKDGSRFTVESQRTLVRDGAGRAQSVFIINTDISQRKEQEARIRKMALYDSMTGLPNRRMFMDRIRQALADGARDDATLALLFLDLNRFKEINDTLGHDVGDHVLIEVARRFQGALQGEELLARLAGDEFVVLAGSANAATAAQLAARLQDTLRLPVAAMGHSFPLSVSIGTALFPEDGRSVEELLKHADLAMYRAKAQGGGHQAYRPDMSAGLDERIEMARRLGLAIEAGTLELYYQPKVRLASGAIDGAEALLRWHDPEWGVISPATFIPLAEARGMIAALGHWVLRAACRQMVAWRAAGLVFPGRLAVNLAAQQLAGPDAAERILAIVRAAGLSPDCFELELTESGLMDNVEHAIGVMATLKAAGFTLAIDDFGTGYSSLSYLKRLPADTLKIDISFVRDMLGDRQDYTIVTTIIGMARNLQLRTVAEGVEQAAQAEALLALGCDGAQG